MKVLSEKASGICPYAEENRVHKLSRIRKTKDCKEEALTQTHSVNKVIFWFVESANSRGIQTQKH